jgi:hypothetical protein
MAKSELQVVICRTCLRDNPGEGNCESFQKNVQFYQEQLKDGWLKKIAKLKYQNCFTHCEKFHCVQVTGNGRGYLFKKISNPQVQQELIEWVRRCKSQGKVEPPEKLVQHIIAPVQSTAKYQKC